MNIQEIHSAIYNIETNKSYYDMVEIFEKIESKFYLIDYNSDYETYEKYSQIIGDYAIALVETNNYKSADPILEKAILLLTQNPKLSNTKIENLDFYEALIFGRAKNNFFLKNYNKAIKDFESLINSKSENKNLKIWLEKTKSEKFKKLKSIFWLIAGAVLIAINFVERNNLLRSILLGIATISFIAAIIIEIIVFKKLKNCA